MSVCLSNFGTNQKILMKLVRKPVGKRSLGKPGCRWKDTKMDLKEISSLINLNGKQETWET
jgi:hypothetical protein